MSGAQIGKRERQLMTIGTFAGRSRISMRALRIYDRLGLLKPAHVDADSGYRRYRVDQLFTARLIVMLRRLDMPLPLIGQVLSAPDGAGGELVRKYWDEVERRIEVQRDLARRVQLGLEGRPLPPASRTVYERDCPRQTLLTEQRHVRAAELDSWVQEATDRLLASAQSYGGPAGARLVIFHGEVSDDSDGPVEICIPIDPARPIPDTVAVRTEPEHREAYVPIPRAQFEVPQILSTYDAIVAWAADNGVTIVGPSREIYGGDLDLDTAGRDDIVCHVAFPIRHVAG
jgi:DNA-binding transcriptional MerR regulator